MIRRDLQEHVQALASRFPIVTVTGPRQGGKTTLCQAAFADRAYASLENPDVREFAASDPRGFLRQFPDGAVLDEVQRVPELASYLQEMVDRDRRPGRWILTGSQHFGLLQSVSQSLAGRTAIVHLLPPSLTELRRFPAPPTGLFETLFAGAYPAIHDLGTPPGEWLAGYVSTYVERDVRQVLNVTDLLAFQTFIRLAAGRAGRVLSLSGLGADAGISHHTARSWISVLETSFIVFRLPPWFGNVGKRLIKSPKLYFYDSGLLCYLLGVRSPSELIQHPLRGAVFESWVISEVAKSRLHRGLPLDLHFYRDQAGAEADLTLESADCLTAVQIKSAQTVSAGFFSSFPPFKQLMARDPTRRKKQFTPLLVYGGDTAQEREAARVIPWHEMGNQEW